MRDDGYRHETTCQVYDKDGKHIGDIEVCILYRVLNWGCPARIRYDENDHPAEPPELDVVHVWMQNSPFHGRDPEWVHAWEWMFDWAQDLLDADPGDFVDRARLQAAE